MLDWLRRRDRGFSALRRAARAAVVMPLLFAFGSQVLDNPGLATFAAFGSFAQLLLVDFSGPLRDRLRAQALLALTGAVFVAVGTLVSQTTWLAALSMALVALAVLFAGVVSSVLAGATTSLLLAFILPVSLPGTVSSIPDRLAGWGLASAAALLAIALLWPAPARDPVRAAVIAACRALAGRLRAEVAHVLGTGTDADHDAAVTRGDAAVETMRSTFFATPYRPTGLTTAARAIVRLVDELQWLNAVVAHARPGPMVVDRHACAVKSAAATVLDRGADVIDRPRQPHEALQASLGELRNTLDALERSATRMLPDKDMLSSLDPSFRAQELSFVVSQIARNVDLAAAAERRSWIDKLLGRRPPGIAGGLAAAQERAGAHVERHSLWLQNSVRGAAGLGLAVLVADLTGAQHAFWVVFGALAVLRSNALSTGQSVLNALLGTTIGFAVGAALVVVIGTNTTLLWILLPFVVLFAGLAPATISFTAGQAAFTISLFVLFNLLAPEGWRIGLVRIEDVALGSAVSLVVGLLFWPRGAATALGTALSSAYLDSANYLAGAVRFGIGDSGAPTDAATRAAAASRRLDDTFRAYLAERGAKPAPLAEVTTLVTGVVALRLAADAVLELWNGERASGQPELLTRTYAVTGWYSGFAASLSGHGAVPAALVPDEVANRQLVGAVTHGLDGPTAVRLVWTGDHLDAALRLQDSLVGPARTATG